MARVLVLCLILANAYVGQSRSEPQTPIPSMPRKIGNHNANKHEVKQVTESFIPPRASPAKEKASHIEAETYHSSTEAAIDHEAVLGTNKELNVGVEVHERKNHQHSVDKSIAGGGVILGGLAMTFFVSVFCYIRATGRSKSDDMSSVPSSPTTPSLRLSSSPSTSLRPSSPATSV